MTRRLFASSLSICVLVVLALTACSEAPVPTATTISFSPTPAPGDGEPTQTAASPTAGPAVTPTQAPSGGDPARGEQLFNSQPCSSCHSTGENTVVGPGLGGLAGRAGTRTELPADEYIRVSIREPGAFLVPGFANIMPQLPLPDQDVEDLVAYLMTLE